MWWLAGDIVAACGLFQAIPGGGDDRSVAPLRRQGGVDTGIGGTASKDGVTGLGEQVLAKGGLTILRSATSAHHCTQTANMTWTNSWTCVAARALFPNIHISNLIELSLKKLTEN